MPELNSRALTSWQLQNHANWSAVDDHHDAESEEKERERERNFTELEILASPLASKVAYGAETHLTGHLRPEVTD